MITHSKACVQCQKSFGRATYLKRHMLTHSGVKAHSCSECEKSFSQVGHLRRHMVTHTGEKVHKCEECGDFFGQAGDLKRHQLIHSWEKPHKCSLRLCNCTNRLSQRSHQNTLHRKAKSMQLLRISINHKKKILPNIFSPTVERSHITVKNAGARSIEQEP